MKHISECAFSLSSWLLYPLRGLLALGNITYVVHLYIFVYSKTVGSRVPFTHILYTGAHAILPS